MNMNPELNCAELPPGSTVPRIIWMLWLQGWDTAPPVALASRSSWRNANPDWTIRALCQDDIAEYLPPDVIRGIFAGPKRIVVIGELIRFELLRLHGGVWADATTICARPLDDWLPDVMPHGFFAFSTPVPSRMISSWFLAAAKDSVLFELWYSVALAYWDTENDDEYFWMHEQFKKAYLGNGLMRKLWDETPAISARHALHFAPDAKELRKRSGPSFELLLEDPPSPVFKLTRKFKRPPKANSVFERLLAYGNGLEFPSASRGRPESLSLVRRAFRRLRDVLGA